MLVIIINIFNVIQVNLGGSDIVTDVLIDFLLPFL